MDRWLIEQEYSENDYFSHRQQAFKMLVSQTAYLYQDQDEDEDINIQKATAQTFLDCYVYRPWFVTYLFVPGPTIGALYYSLFARKLNQIMLDPQKAYMTSLEKCVKSATEISGIVRQTYSLDPARLRLLNPFTGEVIPCEILLS